jgi:hypothetical protein
MTDRIDSLKLLEEDKQALRAEFEGRGPKRLGQSWQRLRRMFDIFGEIVLLLESTEWHVDGDQILFANDADVQAYNRYLEQIQSIGAASENDLANWLRGNR